MRANREAFAAAMVKKELTVNQVAATSGLTRATVSAVKNGKSCSQVTADKLMSVLGREIFEGRGVNDER